MSNYFCRKAVLQFFPGNFSEQEKNHLQTLVNGKFHKVVVAQIRLSNFFSRIFRSEALVYNNYSYYISVEPFYINYLTLDSRTNAIIIFLMQLPTHQAGFKKI